MTAHLDGEQGAAVLLPIVYEELRSLAARYLRAERRGGSLQATDLVHEAYLRLQKCEGIDWKGRTHFFAMAATQMRRVLVDHARAAAADKRGGRPTRISLADDLAATPERSVEFLALDQALARLSERHERQGRVAEMRLFSGLEVKEMAAHLGVSERTVKEDWRVARAWILKEISPGAAPA